jgi:hypothetical protein
MMRKSTVVVVLKQILFKIITKQYIYKLKSFSYLCFITKAEKS